MPSFVETWRQHASGEFKAAIVPGTPHCGLNETANTFRYEVHIEYHGDDSTLDNQGFLLDNLTFQAYFESLPPTDLSCELVAKKAAKHFATLVPEKVRTINVRVYPFNGVYVEAEVSRA